MFDWVLDTVHDEAFVPTLMFGLFISFWVLFFYLKFNNPVERAKKNAEIEHYEAESEKARFIARVAANDIDPSAMPTISVAEAAGRIDVQTDAGLMNNGLTGAVTKDYIVSGYAILDDLREKHAALIRKRDAETHPEIREDLTATIASLREVIRAREKQAVVQAGGRNGLGDVDQDSDES